MQAVTELAVLDVANELIDARDRLERTGGSVQAKIILDPKRLRFGADIVLQTIAPFRVKAARVGKFVQQGLKPRQPKGRARLNQRRGYVPQRDGPDPAFGLCRFAGIVDDEGVDDRHIAGQGVRPAVL